MLTATGVWAQYESELGHPAKTKLSRRGYMTGKLPRGVKAVKPEAPKAAPAPAPAVEAAELPKATEAAAPETVVVEAIAEAADDTATDETND